MKLIPVLLWLTLSMTMSIVYAGSFEDGMIAFHAGDYKKAMEIWSPLAEEGEVEAQVKLGIMHTNGLGVRRNGGEALKWFHKAAEKGNAEAEYYLGKLYGTQQSGVEMDQNESTKWYRKAAEDGNADAQYAMGAKYFKGEGLPMDYVMGYAWMDVAARQGHYAAPNYRDLIALILSTEDIAKAKALSDELAKK